MSPTLTAAARTPWVSRHGRFARCSPEQLAAAAIDGATRQGGIDAARVHRLVLACDTLVGAQSMNLARRVALLLGWEAVPALTVDAQGVGDFAALDIAVDAALSNRHDAGVTVVAAVDVTSTVPPGAALVRDFGRPTVDEPESVRLERLVAAAELTRADLDRAVAENLPVGPRSAAGVVPVRANGVLVDADDEVVLEVATDLEPLHGEGGVLTAAHMAQLADGAAAVIIDPHPSTEGRSVDVALTATAHDATIESIAELAGDATAIADRSVVIHQVAALPSDVAIPSVLALGSVPSADGLRMVVDGYHAVPRGFRVLRRGRDGQLAWVDIGPVDGTRDGDATPSPVA